MTLLEDTFLENRYRIDGLLAHGGMGSIYRGFDTNLSTPVAIKENFLRSSHHIAQFKQEALILARLRHPALPRVMHHFSFEGQQYLVMDFIDGENLWGLIERRGESLPENEALDYLIQVCQAVNYLHRQKPPIIHRDIKPQNIKITPTGRAMLVDFGIAKLAADDKTQTEIGAQGTTSGFSPPEQYGKGGTGPASDIYALGATLYTALTGQKPPHSLVLLAGKAKLMPPQALNSVLNPELEGVIKQAMQPKVEDRPSAVIDWQKTLEAIAGVTLGNTATLASKSKALLSKSRGGTVAQAETAHRQSSSTKYWLVDPTGMGYPLGSEPLSIGRHSSAGVTLDDLNISRIHTLLRVEGKRCLVKDENSANGTFLNGHRLSSEWYPLNQGDVLIIGPARFYLTSTQPAKLAPPKVKSAPASVAPLETIVEATPKKVALNDAQETLKAVATPPKARHNSWLIGGLLLIILLLAGLAAYLWFNQSTSARSNETALQLSPSPPVEVIITPSADLTTGVDLTTPVDLRPTQQLDPGSQQTVTTETATKAAETGQAEATTIPTLSTNTPPLKKTPVTKISKTATIITPQSSKTAIPTATSSPTQTSRVTSVVTSSPTFMPLNSNESVTQIGSKEVTDVEINPRNSQEVFVLVKQDGIYKSEQGGDGPWARVDMDGKSLTSIVIDPFNPTRIYATTWNAVLKSEDGGNSWDPKTGGLVANQVVDIAVIHPLNPDILYAGIGETLVVSTDQGQTWTSEGFGRDVRLARIYAIVVDPFNDDNLYVGGLGAALYKSQDGGQSFLPLGYNVGKGVYGLAAHPHQAGIYVAGINSGQAGIIKTQNGFDFVSASGGLIYGGADSAYSALTYIPTNPNVIYAGSGYESEADAKGIFKSIDGGETWSSINNGLAINPDTGHPHYVKVIAIDPQKPNTIFAATGSGLYKSGDGGANWVLK